MSTKIFVGSLPSGCKPEELRHLFESFGVVTECDVMNRCGFVHMEKPEMAATAIKALNATEFKGETINVEPGRVRERNQKPGGIGGNKGAGPGQRSRGVRRMQNFEGIDEAAMGLEGIDERTTKDALQLCSAVFEEMNKLLHPNQGGGSHRGGGGMGFPPNFIEEQLGAVMGGMGGPRGPNRGPRNNRNNGPPKQVQVPVEKLPMKNNANQAPRGALSNQGNRGPKQGAAVSGPQGRGQNQGNDGRMQNQGNQGFAGRNQNQGNAGRLPKQGNIGPIRSEPPRPRRLAAPYNRSAPGPIDDINFADDIPIAQSARNFANNLAGGSQIDRWPQNGGNFVDDFRGRLNNHPMNRNFDEDMPVNNFVDDAPIVINMVTRGSGGGGMGGGGGISGGGARRGGPGNQAPVNQGNFGHNTGGGNDRFQGGNNDRFQNSGNNDRFQGNSGGGERNFGMGNQDRRGFALPEQQMFNESPKFGNQDRIGGNSSFGGHNNQGSLGGSNRNFGNNAIRQQNIPESRNIGGGGGGNAMFTRRPNNSGGNLDANNMGNNRMHNDVQDTNRGGNFGGNNSRGMGSGSGGNMNNNNAGLNRTNNLHGPIGGNNRNMGGGVVPNNRNMGGSLGNNNNNRNMGGGVGNNRNMGGASGNNSNRNMGGGVGNNNNRNMGGNVGINTNRNMGGNNSNNMNRNNMGGGNQMNPMNFQKDFPALTGGQNMNNRNGPRQNMMSNRRY